MPKFMQQKDLKNFLINMFPGQQRGTLSNTLQAAEATARRIPLVPGPGVARAEATARRIPLVPGPGVARKSIVPQGHFTKFISGARSGIGGISKKIIPFSRSASSKEGFNLDEKIDSTPMIDQFGLPKHPSEKDDPLLKFMALIRTGEANAFANRYEVEIHPPAQGNLKIAIGNLAKGAKSRAMPAEWTGHNLDIIRLRCESITMPGRNLISAADSNIYGPPREIVSGVTFAEEISCTFQASADLKERRMFEAWQELAFNPYTWNVGYHNDYVGIVKIFLLNRQNKKKFGIFLIEAYPKTIGPSELSYSSNNELIKIPVSFSFRTWESWVPEQAVKKPLPIRDGGEVIEDDNGNEAEG